MPTPQDAPATPIADDAGYADAPPGPLAPPVPAELWGLWNDASAAVPSGQGRFWVPSIDDAPHGGTILVAMSEAEAVFAAIHQNESYGLNCRPVRIK